LAKGVAEPPSRYHFWYLFKPQGAHHEIYKTTWVYIGKKKLYLSNKHLVIFWVISIGHTYNFVFPIVIHDWLYFVFFIIIYLLRVQFLSTCYFDTRKAYMLLLVQNRHTKYYLCIKYHLWYNYKIKVLVLVLIKTTWGTSW